MFVVLLVLLIILILVTQSETIKLLLALVDCYRISLQRNLNEEIENLTESLTCLKKSFSDRQRIFMKLQAAEKKLSSSKNILPTALPKEIVDCIASLSSVNNEIAHWGNKFDKMGSANKSNSRSSSISIPEWISILNNAHNVLTDNDWNYISVHVVSLLFIKTNNLFTVFQLFTSCIQLKSVKSARFCRLYWLHRLRPGLGRGHWSTEELDSLKSVVDDFGPYGQWERIAERLNTGRTGFACFKAWHKYLNPEHPSVGHLLNFGIVFSSCEIILCLIALACTLEYRRGRILGSNRR